MASQIRPRPLNGAEKPPKPVKNRSYMDFIHSLPCVVTGKYGVEAAHLSTSNPVYGHTGRGRSQKAADMWILSLSSAEHRKQHDMRETQYWSEAGINPWRLCSILWMIFSTEGPDAGISVALEAIRRAKT